MIHPYPEVEPSLSEKIKKMADQIQAAGFSATERDIYAAMFPPRKPELTDLDIMPRSIAHKPKRWAHKLNRK